MIVSAYLSRAHLDDIEGSCPLIGLPTDVARGGAAVKAAYAEVLEMMVGAFAAQLGPDQKAAREKALGIAALCVGGMVLARAVDDPAVADDLREAARKLASTIGAWEAPPAEPT
jgi:TetR/AcrR family transcriptional regulator, transcriptional repressor for nem operon